MKLSNEDLKFKLNSTSVCVCVHTCRDGRRVGSGQVEPYLHSYPFPKIILIHMHIPIPIGFYMTIPIRIPMPIEFYSDTYRVSKVPLIFNLYLHTRYIWLVTSSNVNKIHIKLDSEKLKLQKKLIFHFYIKKYYAIRASSITFIFGIFL